MIHGSTIVVDIGKTNAKVSLWNANAELVERHVRPNESQQSSLGYRALNVSGIDRWLTKSIAEFARMGPVARIVPVGHGAAAVLVSNGQLHLDPMDYEEAIPDVERTEYNTQRDPFSQTGSPALPVGLNLGAQLHQLENLTGPIPENVQILPWPQYWAWRFCGIASSEVSSLGCHTDLWRPTMKSWSQLAVRRGWSKRMAPLREAGDVLGPITSEFAAATGLNPDCEVLCGLHDSNAALVAAWGHSEIAEGDATVLSTGTWFIGMRSLPPESGVDMALLEEARDCLVNVDVYGRPTPSARLMGGREAELIAGINSFALTDGIEPEEFLRRLPGLMVECRPPSPSFVHGVGPFPDGRGAWPERPKDPIDERVLTHVYLALMADAALDLIGSRDRLLVEGRFAEDIVFVRSLASLRPGQRVYTSNAEHDVAFGALRLIAPELCSSAALTPVEPLSFDINKCATSWRERATKVQGAA